MIESKPDKQEYCVECGNRFATNELVCLLGNWVCAACKARVVQKLKEGVPIVPAKPKFQSAADQARVWPDSLF